MEKPTTRQYGQYQKLYDYYNHQLFGSELPECLLILSRKTARMCGHFSHERWQDTDGKKTHEISLNPVYLATATDQDICQTIVHEMVHLWQFEYGKPSRPGYHNTQWANKMESVGLMPSHTGKPGGKKTGQQMADYAIDGGVFMQAFETMPKDVLLPFKSSEVVGGKLVIGGVVVGGSSDDKPEPEAPKPKNKVKYSCPRCGTNAWGKPDLALLCYTCVSEAIGDRKTASRQTLDDCMMVAV